MRKIKLLTLLVALLFSAGMWAQTKVPFEQNGTCGDNLTYTLTGEYEDYGGYAMNYEFSLVITGTGAMTDYSDYAALPWVISYSYYPTSVTLPEGLTHIGNNAFKGVKMTTIDIPSTVTSIGKSAFIRCPNLTSLTIPAAVTSIGEQVVAECAALTSLAVESGNTTYDSRNNCNAIIETATNKMIAGCKNTVIPNGVTSIGNYVFYKQTGLTSISIPGSVTTIGEHAFEDCTGLTSLSFAEGLTTIDWNAFKGCTGLATSVTIPSTVTSIDTEAFTGCPFTSFVVADGNTTYDSRDNCNALIQNRWGNVTLIAGFPNSVIPDEVTAIADYAFASQSTLTAVTIPASITKVGYKAFNDCSGLESITCLTTTPPTVDKTFNSTFLNVSTTIPVYVPAGTKATYEATAGWNGFTNFIELDPEQDPDPEQGDEPVMPTFACGVAASGSCGDHLLWAVNCTGDTLKIAGYGEMTDFDFRPEYNINTIPWKDYRFQIKHVELPDGLTHLGSYALYQFEKMPSVVIPEGVTSIGYVAIASNHILTSMSLPSTLTTLDDEVFGEDWALPSLTIPAAVTSIGYGLTDGCVGLEEIVVEEGNTKYDSRNDCNAIIKTNTNTLIAGCKKTKIPNNVTTIAEWAFSGMRTMEAMKIPNSVTKLERYSFQYCQSMTDLVLPSSVTSIDPSAFAGCVFNTITVNPGNPKYDSRDNCNGIIETATNILVKGSNSTVLPDEVAVIGDGALWSCWDLKYLNIPATITRIDHYGIIFCKSLESISCHSVTPPQLGENAIYSNYYENSTEVNINPDIPVYVPAASIETYRTTDGWNYFTNYLPIEGKYTVKALASHGTVTGTGTYTAGTEIELSATPDEGYEFKQWSDGTTDNPKSLTVTKDMTIRALFESTNVQEEDEPVVEKDEDNVMFTFVAMGVAVSIYEMEVYRDGMLVVELIFNNSGTILSSSIASPAPLRYKVRKAIEDPAEYLTVTLTGLDLGKQYTYTLEAYAEDESSLGTMAGSFDTPCENCLRDNADAETITNSLSDWDNGVPRDVSIIRTVQRNGYYNTLCLPFSMTALQIANSSLNGAVIKEFTDAAVNGDELQITLMPVSEIVAGKPYFVKYENATALSQLNFEAVTVNSAAPEGVTHGGMTMIGTYVPYEVDAQTSATDGAGVLFLGQNNQLYWPSTAGTIKPFRAYFTISGGSGAPIRRGMPARIIEATDTATDVEVVEGMNTNAESIKVIENGTLYIIRNGEKYNAMGQIIK